MLAAQVRLAGQHTVEQVRLWGVYTPDDTPPAPDFSIIVHDMDAGNQFLPGGVVYAEASVAAVRTPTGRLAGGFTEYEVVLTPASSIVLAPGSYWFEIFDDTTGDNDSFNWSGSRYSRGFFDLAFTRASVPGTSWQRALTADMAMELIEPAGVAVCDGDADGNGVVDINDVSFVIFRLGSIPGSCGPGDADGSGGVDVNDIAYVIFRLGTCNPGCPCGSP